MVNAMANTNPNGIHMSKLSEEAFFHDNCNAGTMRRAMIPVDFTTSGLGIIIIPGCPDRCAIRLRDNCKIMNVHGGIRAEVGDRDRLEEQKKTLLD